MNKLCLIFQIVACVVALKCTIAGIHEFEAGDINNGLASLTVVIGAGVFQVMSIATILMVRDED